MWWQGGSLSGLLARCTVADDVRHGVLDARPVVALGNGCGGLVDAGVLLEVDIPSNLVLTLGVGNHLLVFEHKDVTVEQLVRGGGAT